MNIRTIGIAAAIVLLAIPASRARAATTIGVAQWKAIAQANAIEKCFPGFLPMPPGADASADGHAVRPATIDTPAKTYPAFNAALPSAALEAQSGLATRVTLRNKMDGWFSAERTGNLLAAAFISQSSAGTAAYVKASPGENASLAKSTGKPVSLAHLTSVLPAKLLSTPSITKCGMKLIAFRGATGTDLFGELVLRDGHVAGVSMSSSP